MKFFPLALSLALAGACPLALWALPPEGAGDAGEGKKEALAALKTFKLATGVRAGLFASEPLLANGVAFTVDEQGRWFVAESYRQEKGVEDNRSHMNWLDDDMAARTVDDRLRMMHKFYPDPAKFEVKFAQAQERIVCVEDSDGDGQADRASVYADGFRDPLDGTGAGLLARGGALWWTCIPRLWRFSGRDGEGRAVEREALLGGFGVKVAFRGHDMHGLRFGPDGKLYFSIGDRGLHVVSKEGVEWSEPDTGAILRCNPDGTGFEVFATGVRNPQELAFNELGDLFTGDNNSDSGDKARFVHLVEGGDCGWRMAFQYLGDRGPWNREMLWDDKEGPKAKYIIPPVVNLANGPAGLTYNPGTGLAPKYSGHFFLADFRGGASGSVVHDIVVEPFGATYKGKSRRDLLTGVLSTDVEFGNDGALYVLDWVESWSGVGKGRIYKLTAEGADQALQEQTRQLIAQGMGGRPAEELAGLLSHADMRVRMAAQFELAARGSGSAEIFLKIARDPGANRLGRLHAIWGLGQLAEKTPATAELLLPLLGEGEAEVRAQAAKVLGERRVAAAAAPLAALLKDASMRVRYFAALSLGKLGQGSSIDALLSALGENPAADPVLRHGLVMGLAGCAQPVQLAAKASDPAVPVRLGAVLALRRLKSEEIAAFLKDPDEAVLLEVVRAIHDVPIEGAMPALAALAGNPSIRHPRILERVINANYRLGQAGHAKLLAALAGQPSIPESARRDALDALASWADPSPKDRVLNLWRPLPARSADDAVEAVSPMLNSVLEGVPDRIQEAATRLAGRLSIKEAGEVLARRAADEQVPAVVRIAGLQALRAMQDPRLVETARAAGRARDGKVRAEALQVLASVDPGAAVELTGELIEHGSLPEKQGAVLALGQMRNPAAASRLGALLEKLAAGQAPAEIQLDIYEAAKKAGMREQVKKFEGALPAGDDQALYRLALAGGDAERGKKVFREHAQAQCIKCHKCEGGESVVGPELSHIGSARSRAELLESILFPGRKIAAGYEIVALSLTDGTAVGGKLVGEEAGALRVETLGPDGKPQVVTVGADKIRERHSAPSPMPENLREVLSKSDLRDLLEYLATRR